MKQNVHLLDRIIRLALGAALISYFFIGNSDYKTFGLIGFIPFITGLIGFCPLYSVLGVDGCGCKKKVS